MGASRRPAVRVARRSVTVASMSADLVRRFHTELLAARDPAVVDAFFGDGFVSHNMPPGFPQGREGVKLFFSTFRDAFPDVTVAIDELVADGDRVAVATTFTGTHTGPLVGVDPTGRRGSVTGVDIVRVAHGEILGARRRTEVP